LEDIKAIAENRGHDIKLPLRILKIEQPEAYRKAYQKAYQNTDKYKAYKRAYKNTDKYKAYQKAYRKALFELKKKHTNEFQRLIGKVQLNKKRLD
jgi:hypothetical protein